MLGVAPLAENEGVILFSASATSPDIASAGDYIFRTAINDLRLGTDMGNTLWVDGVRKIVTITEATDYAEGTRRTAVEQFEKLGGSVLTAESYSSDVIDFRSQLTKLFNENPDALLLAAQGEFSGGTIIKQARELGYEGPIYSEIVPTAPEALSIAGDAATGLKAIVPNPDLNSAAGKEFLANFRARYGVVASLPWFQGSAYDDVFYRRRVSEADSTTTRTPTPSRTAYIASPGAGQSVTITASTKTATWSDCRMSLSRFCPPPSGLRTIWATACWDPPPLRNPLRSLQ